MKPRINFQRYFMQIYSFSPFGYEGALVTVEVDIRRGIPAIDLVGLADNAVKEARERMQAAIRNSGFDFPPERVLISLSPADLKKEGAGFDLPIALAVLHAQQNSSNPESDSAASNAQILIMGELELSGKIRAVRGVHAAASTAAAGGIRMCIVPAANADEAREAAGMAVFGADTLEDAFAALNNHDVFSKKTAASENDREYYPDCEFTENVPFCRITDELEYAHVKGQKKLVRALQVAAAGGHNLLAVGAPGCGKTMALQKFPALVPALTKEESQSVSRIHSLAGLMSPDKPAVCMPPFRMPHQTATIEGLCGGGTQCRPGEISLAHNGILFLDEAPEFKSSVLQMLRVPMETARISLSRAGRSTVFPADFQLLMAANPCPCGNFGSENKICLCSARSIEMYWKKFSAPLLDRVDIRIYVSNENTSTQESEPVSTSELRKAIARAVIIQRKRQGKKNSKLTPPEIVRFCIIDKESKAILDASCSKYGFSPRAASSILKLSRTIADMEEKNDIEQKDVMEAIELRKSFCNFMELSE